ncbi:hypothetical protein [Mucilaginibacter sp.]|uniref:hypothetical protein n=1 Tax=Mucilaginibacter sp. TaxID=1882438 RepID=UPI00261831C3|nr:hypothetical protein [Mucilaginibacter sp.]
MKKLLNVFIALIIICNHSFAQNRNTTLEARISYLEEIKNDSEYKGLNPSKGFAISFINNSDQDIFIPYFLKLIHNKSDMGIFISYYRKESGGYKLIPRPFSTGDDIAGLPMLLDTFNQKNRTAEKKLFAEIKKYNKAKSIVNMDNILENYSSRALFLKAHKEREYYMPMEISPYVSNMPGRYKVAFEPMLAMPVKDEFPEFIMGYKKFIPTAIKSNPVYIHFEPMRRPQD